VSTQVVIERQALSCFVGAEQVKTSMLVVFSGFFFFSVYQYSAVSAPRVSDGTGQLGMEAR
jgi:hypothetical protein